MSDDIIDRDTLSAMVKTISLNEVIQYSNNILSRKISGRIVVDTNK